MGALVGLLGLVGVGLAIIMLFVRVVFKKGWEYNKIWTLAGVALVLLVVGIVASPSAKEGYEAGRQAATGGPVIPVSSPQKQTTQKPQGENTKNQPSWNTKDLNIETNGNMRIALNCLQSLDPSEIKLNAENISPASALKTPWKYYGKILKVSGTVGYAQEYPPGSDISEAFGGGEVGELSILTDDMTPISFMQIGSTGDINVNDYVVVYGYPVGLVELENSLGGTITQLAIVGKVAEKAVE